MDYKKEIAKHQDAIQKLYKEQRREKLKKYYVIFACITTYFHSCNGKLYYINGKKYSSRELLNEACLVKENLNAAPTIEDCLFTKEEAICFATNSVEPEIVKAGIRPAFQEIPNDESIDILDI